VSCSGTSTCTCGCCSGTSVQTPQPEYNQPGLPAISYRTGTWASFKESMLARLSSSDYPALALLKTRADDDFTIALLDATAIVLDILTFYQERLANESYLRTALQPRSLTELSRLIGYQPAPGVSAQAYLAFTLKTTPGQPVNPATPQITIPQGTQVQSVPAQGQTPQTFETSVDIQAKPDWTALQVQLSQPWTPNGPPGIYLAGTATQLQLGDSLLILGVEREKWTSQQSSPPPDSWDVVVLNQVQTNTVLNLTFVSWKAPLSHSDGAGSGPWTVARVFAFRQKASLFGHNAPNPNLFANSNRTPSFNNLINAPVQESVTNLASSRPAADSRNGPTDGAQQDVFDEPPPPWSWVGFSIQSASAIDLDAAYPKIVVGSWFALTSAGSAQLYNVQQAIAVSVARFTLSGKVTELTPDYLDPAIPGNTGYDLRLTEVWAQSDELSVAGQPLPYPLYGTTVSLDTHRTDMAGIQVIALTGKRQKIAVADQVTSLTFSPDDDSSSTNLDPGDILTLTGPFPFSVSSTATGPFTLNVEDANGRPGTVAGVSLENFTLAPSASTDPQVSEYALVNIVDSTGDPAHTVFTLANPLTYCYERATTTLNANVAPATHGQSVTEIMGNGSAATPNQSFTLRQSPLTYVQAATPSGSQTTLQIQANGVPWMEVSTLYDQLPSALVYSTLYQADTTTDVLFGDGIEGATLPTGQNNLQATYRIGSGSSGNVAAGALSTLVDRPLGVSGVSNPAPATGGQDPQSISDIRSNAPMTVLTLGRAVSITDYQNFAAIFPGIAKANAIWIPYGPARGVFLTVAAAGGVPLPNSTHTNLVASLRNYGNRLTPIAVQSFQETFFGLAADIKYDPPADQPTVQPQVLQALQQAFGFSQRDFGQSVSVDEVAAVILGVQGVVAVNVKGLTPGAVSKICAYIPVPGDQSTPQPADILVLKPDPSSVVLGVMS
jgi:hypothetical protein